MRSAPGEAFPETWTGGTSQVWSYGGSGPTHGADGSAGTISERENNSLGSGYSIRGSWLGSSWTYTGAESTASLDAGQWSSSASGAYQQVSAGGVSAAVVGTTGAIRSKGLVDAAR